MNTYRKRHAESSVEKLAKMFGAILVSGPRQVGKTTMLQKITEGINYVTLDDMMIRAVAREESGTYKMEYRRRPEKWSNGGCFF